MTKHKKNSNQSISFEIILLDLRKQSSEVFCKKCILGNFAKFTGKHRLFLLKLQAWGLQLYLKKTLAQVFSCEFCEISKNTFSYRAPLVAASKFIKGLWKVALSSNSFYFEDITSEYQCSFRKGYSAQQLAYNTDRKMAKDCEQ